MRLLRGARNQFELDNVTGKAGNDGGYTILKCAFHPKVFVIGRSEAELQCGDITKQSV